MRTNSALEMQKIARRPIVDITDPSSHAPYSPVVVPSAMRAAKESDASHKCCARFGTNRARLHTACKWLIGSVCEAYAWDLGEFWAAEQKSGSLACCHVASHTHGAEEARGLREFRALSQLMLIEPNIDPIGNVRRSNLQTHTCTHNARMCLAEPR